MTVRTRFAPSPTGYLHVGGIRTALFAWAFAKQHHGSFILRIEDTDTVRSTAENSRMILEALDWLKLDYSALYYQSQRTALYQQVIQDWLRSGQAYHCYIEGEDLQLQQQRKRQGGLIQPQEIWRPEPGKTLPPVPTDRTPVVRFKMPRSGEIGWKDLVKGYLSFPNDQLYDVVIARSDGSPTYHLCSAIDDWDMKMTHIIRGDDHVNNTAIHLHLLAGLGAKQPDYAHLPMILTPQGQKLSKRDGAASVQSYQQSGILADALLNYLARLGWAYEDQELFSRQQFIEWFDWAQVNPSSARFDLQKLHWINQHYIKEASSQSLSQQIQPWLPAQTPLDEKLLAAITLYQSRCSTLQDLAQAIYPLLEKNAHAHFDLPDLSTDDALQAALQHLYQQLQTLEQWPQNELEQQVKHAAKAHQLKLPQLAKPLRQYLIGTPNGPAFGAIMAYLGQATCLARLAPVAQEAR